ncbi:MAG: DUF4198 domain-containing protein [Candidatus Binatia bacterium]|nr:DUF4198 domain-containing protein [Candidatus Binatia bacterium]
MRIVCTALALLLAATTAGAHEFWVEPESFTPSVGDRVAVRLFVGDAGEREEIARRSDHLLRFESVRAESTEPVVGLLGRAPAGMLSLETPGELLLVYQGRHTFIELPAEKFESYLQTEDLARVIAERVRRNESLSPGRETYARYAKSLVNVGEVDDGQRVFSLEVGLLVEVVLETDPRGWRVGDPLVVRVLYGGRPLADQSLKLIHLIDRELQLHARTDAEGRAELQPPQPGPWLVATVFMRRAGDGVEGDWESFWASLTLELPPVVSKLE